MDDCLKILKLIYNNQNQPYLSNQIQKCNLTIKY